MKNARQHLREIFYLLGNDRRRLPGLLLLFLATSMLDIAGLGLIVPYISLVVNPEQAMTGTLGQLATQFGVESSSEELLIFLGWALLIIFGAKAVSAIWINHTIIAFSQQQKVRLCSFLMQSYQRLPYTVYLRRNSSEYIHSIHGLTGQFSGLVMTLLQAASNGIVSLVIMAMLAWSNVLALLLLLGLLCGTALGYDWLIRRRLYSYGQQINQASIQMVQGIHEAIEGFKEIRILGREAYFHQLVQRGAQKEAEIGLKNQVISTVPRYLYEVLLVAFVVLLVLVTLRLGYNLQALLPTLGLFGVAALRLVPSANVLSTSLIKLRFGQDGVSRLYRDLRQLEQLERVPGTVVTQAPEPFRKLTLNNVVFTYPQATQPALRDISLQLTAGESLGLIGSSGAGKTTLVDLLLGLLEPQAGDLRYNGRSLTEALPEWRSHVAYLPQQVFLIDNTVRRNVALGEADLDIDETRLHEALRQARLSEVVEQLPHGVDTLLGEHGVRFSGGQRQRVALARAFYHRRSILVMDEATSALDNETEREIVDEIQRLKGQKTMIVIAHRLTTVQYCDRIYRLEHGRIVEQGPSEQVLRKAG
jgi:ABC-type bacteriocin/lantibiotic exporter with double-glycine peptidase domain